MWPEGEAFFRTGTAGALGSLWELGAVLCAVLAVLVLMMYIESHRDR